jgi:F-type H+-transporting ATPase subunit delta
MVNFSSSKFANIARPYALAAFAVAREKQQLLAWKTFLDSAAYVAQQDAVVAVLANPEILPNKLFDLFYGVLASITNVEQKNFLSLLAQNKRLMLLPEIADLFKAYYAALEKISAVRVVTAIEIGDEYKQKLAAALTRRIQYQVTLKCEIDPALIGGAIIHIGDRVIDGSIRGKLTRLREFSLR